MFKKLLNLTLSCLQMLLIPVSADVPTVNVHLISILPYDGGSAVALVSSGAALNLAVTLSNERYYPSLNFTLHVMANASHKECADVAGVTVAGLGEYYYTKTTPDSVYALVSSQCTDTLGVRSVATEWDWLLLSNGLAQDDFLNNSVAPTAMAVGGLFSGFAVPLLLLFQAYGWSHVTILLLADKDPTFYNVLSPLMMQHARQLNGTSFQIDVYAFDQGNQSMTQVLLSAKKRSRVFVILAYSSVARQMLAVADGLGLNNGEYVFVNVQPLAYGSYGKPEVFNFPDIKNSIVYRSFLYITYRPAGQSVKQLNQILMSMSKTMYNRTYNDGSQPLDNYATRAAFDLVDFVATVVNETLQTSSSSQNMSWSGKRLADRMSGRTFSLTTGDVYIDEQGARYIDLDVFAFQTSSRTMQRIGQWSLNGDKMMWSHFTVDWPTPNGDPPPDMPLCGFSGSAGDCMSTGNSVIVSVIPIVIIAILIAAVMIYMKLRSHDLDARNWIIPQTDMHLRRSSYLVEDHS